MIILYLSLLLLLILLALRFSVRKDKNAKLILPTIIILTFAIVVTLFNYTSADMVLASTPKEIYTHNTTGETLKVYTSIYWSHSNGSGFFVDYYGKVPSKESLTFWTETDGADELWLIAKNNSNEIQYLEITNDFKGEFNYKIISNHISESEKVQEALDLTRKRDMEVLFRNIGIYANLILIIILIIDFLKKLNFKKMFS